MNKRLSVFKWIVFSFGLWFPAFLNAAGPGKPDRDSLLSVIASGRDDSLRVKSLMQAAELFSYVTDSGKLFATRALVLSEKINFPFGIRVSSAFLGNNAIVHGEYDQALQFYSRALTISHLAGDMKGTADMMMGIGLVYYSKSDLEKALKSHLASLKLRETIQDTSGMASSYISVANIFQYKGELARATEYNLKALAIKRIKKDLEGQVYCLGNIGTIYGIRKEFDTALSYFTQALSLAELAANARLQANTLGNIGSVYEHKGDDKKALQFHLKALEMDEQINNTEGISSTLINLGGLYARAKNNALAISHYRRSLELAVAMGALDNQQIIYAALADVYHNARDEANAFLCMKKYSTIKDSILNVENQESLNRLEELYLSEKKDKELLQKDAEISRQSEESGRQKLVIMFSGFFLVFVLVFTIVLLNRIKITRRQKAIIEQKQKEILDSIHYAKRIQNSLMPSEKNIERAVARLKNRG